MDKRTGKIHEMDEVQRMKLDEKKFMMDMKLPPTEEQLKNGKVGRNDPCPCGSGKKFKKCCIVKIKRYG